MKRIFLLDVALLLSAVPASATATVQKWTAGWDNFGEALNYTRSKISWSVNATTHKLSVTFTLVGRDAQQALSGRNRALLQHFSRDLRPVSG